MIFLYSVHFYVLRSDRKSGERLLWTLNFHFPSDREILLFLLYHLLKSAGLPQWFNNPFLTHISVYILTYTLQCPYSPVRMCSHKYIYIYIYIPNPSTGTMWGDLLFLKRTLTGSCLEFSLFYTYLIHHHHHHGTLYPWPVHATLLYRPYRLVFRDTFCIGTGLLYVGSIWSSCLYSSLWRGP